MLLKGSKAVGANTRDPSGQVMSEYLSAFLKEDRTSSCELIRPRDRQQLPQGPLRSREASVL